MVVSAYKFLQFAFEGREDTHSKQAGGYGQCTGKSLLDILTMIVDLHVVGSIRMSV
jgi:hypothetical protein